VKIQRMRSNLEEKLMKRMAVVHRKAEEMREAARQQHSEQVEKASEQARKMINRHNSHFPRHNSCGCFPCNNHH
jgi:F0F1-type ATP synthase membrane subunit b/b'